MNKNPLILARDLFQNHNPLSANPTKWSNTQTIRRQFADESFVCV